ncbi:MAG TPA: DNA polymerase IV [Terriglobia bacterium]|nr:DNA polymerase IV [Terriglobia bacterium]
MIRQILHVDMDAFFVSVEELEDPSLIGKAVIVGGDPGSRGVVASASYEARKFGVHSAMPLQQAKRRCPHAIFIRGHYEKYGEYSQKIHQIFTRFTPAVEMVSVDEAYLDMTGCERLHGPMLHAADTLIRAVKKATGLSCSVGASTSHIVSKIASDQAKPHGLLCIFPGCEKSFLAPLPIRRMPGVGKVSEPKLRACGIETIGDVQRQSPEDLKRRLGKFGGWLYRKSLGQDIEAYAWHEEARSISHETTFAADVTDFEIIQQTISELSQRLGHRLRHNGFMARTVGLKLRYASFQTVSRERTLRQPSHFDLEIYQTALDLFRVTYDRRQKVRLLGVRATNLVTEARQASLLDQERERKMGRVLETADQLRGRFGFSSVQFARSLGKRDEER